MKKPKTYRRNADTALRGAELQFRKEPARDHWVKWLHESLRSGSPLFTAEGVASATGGAVTDFQITEDGFRAKLTSAEYPELEAVFRIGPEDWESLPRGAYNAEIWVQWSRWDDDLSLYININEIVDFFSVQPDSEYYAPRPFTMPGGEYHYIGVSTQNDEQLMAACRNPKEWESV